MFCNVFKSVLHCRQVCEFASSTIFGASEQSRSNSTAMQSFMASYPVSDLIETTAERVWRGSIFTPVDGTIDAEMLNRWHTGSPSYDGLFVNSWSNSSKVLPDPTRTGIAPKQGYYHPCHAEQNNAISG